MGYRLGLGASRLVSLAENDQGNSARNDQNGGTPEKAPHEVG